MLRDQKARLKTSKDRKIPMIKTMKHMYSMSHKTSVKTISRVQKDCLHMLLDTRERVRSTEETLNAVQPGDIALDKCLCDRC